MPKFAQYVEKIVRETDATREEKEDLREELLIHLELSYAEKRQEGYSEKEAERLVLEDFGISAEIGSQIQEAMFPYRKTMIRALAIVSIIFSIAVYVSQLLIYEDAYIGWLLFSVIVGTILLIFTIQPISVLNRRFWMNSLLLVHLFVYIYGMLIATSLEGEVPVVLIFLSWFIILFSIVLIYRTTIFDVPADKYTKVFHALNLTTGVVVIAITLFFVWAALVFGGFESNPFMLMIFIPFLIWLISYIVGGQFILRQKKMIAYSISTVPMLTILSFYILLY